MVCTEFLVCTEFFSRIYGMHIFQLMDWQKSPYNHLDEGLSDSLKLYMRKIDVAQNFGILIVLLILWISEEAPIRLYIYIDVSPALFQEVYVENCVSARGNFEREGQRKNT